MDEATEVLAEIAEPVEPKKRLRYGPGWARDGQQALFAEAAAVHRVREAVQVTQVAVRDLPRSEFAPEPGMVDSVRAYGVLEPIILSSDGLRILDGMRRVAAIVAVMGPDELVPVLYGGEGATAEAMYTLTANWHRSQNLATEAQAVKTLLQQGYSVERIARTFKVTIAKVSGLVRIAGLPKVLYAALQSCDLPPSIAIAVARLSPVAQHALAASFAETGILTSHDVQVARDAGHENIGHEDLFGDAVPEALTVEVLPMWREVVRLVAAAVRFRKRGDVGVLLLTGEQVEFLRDTLEHQHHVRHPEQALVLAGRLRLMHEEMEEAGYDDAA